MKPSEQHLWPREAEVLKLIKAGHPQKEIASMMGIKLTTTSGYISNLRRKGLIPFLTKGPGRRIKEVGPYPSQRKKDPLADPPPLGMPARVVEAPVGQSEAEAPPRRRKTREGVTITMHALAKRLDDEIHNHVQAGGRLEDFHRWALVLTAEILGS